MTLRIAAQYDGDAAFATVVAERIHVSDAPVLVAELRERGLLDGERVSDAGAALLVQPGADIKELTAPIWTDLASDDVAAAE